MRSYIFIIISKLILLQFLNYSFAQAMEHTNTLEKQNISITKKQVNLVKVYCTEFPNNTQLSIGFIKNGEVQFYGVKRSNDSLSSIVNHQNVFEIGSITKVFTATLLANFVVNDQLSLNDSALDSSAYKLATDTNISWLHLANHTAGLPRLPSNLNLLTINANNPYKNYGEKELTEYLSVKIALEQKPGEKYGYSNLGAGVLGYLLPKQYNSTYINLLNKHVFSKYGMLNSTANQSKLIQPLIVGLDALGKPTSNWDMNALQGAGAILSTVEDLSKFALAHFDTTDKALALTRQSTFAINENMDIGLAWHILKNQDNSTWYWHNGGTGGYTSSIAIDTATKNGIVILSNVSAFHAKMGNIDLLCFALMKTLN